MNDFWLIVIAMAFLVIDLVLMHRLIRVLINEVGEKPWTKISENPKRRVAINELERRANSREDLVYLERTASPEDILATIRRTIAWQIEYWAKVGRAALDNPDLPVSFIAESLASLAEPRSDSTPFVPRKAMSDEQLREIADGGTGP